MRIEILAIGNELLAGKTINSNAALISLALEREGYLTSLHQVVPDIPKEMESAISSSLHRSDLLIITGGLGPTLDDLTKKEVAKLLQKELVIDTPLLESLKKRFPEKASYLPGQATILKGATIIANQVGTACGLLLSQGEKTIILLPGVPQELAAMLPDVMHLIKQKHPLTLKNVHKELFFCLLAEMDLDPILRKIQKEKQNVAAGIYPFFAGVCVRFSTQASSLREASSILDPCLEILKEKFPTHYYSSFSGKVEEAIHNLLIEKKLTLSLAESCTGGRLSAAFTSMAGSSNYFLGSVVSYSNQMKENILHVSTSTLQKKGAVSVETVKEMAQGILSLTGSDYAIAVSGIAGPSGGSAEKPVGTVCIAVVSKNSLIDAGVIHAPGGRSCVIGWTVNTALGILYRHLAFNKSFFPHE